MLFICKSFFNVVITTFAIIVPLVTNMITSKFDVALDVTMTFDVNSCCKPIKHKRTCCYYVIPMLPTSHEEINEP